MWLDAECGTIHTYPHIFNTACVRVDKSARPQSNPSEQRCFGCALKFCLSHAIWEPRLLSRASHLRPWPDSEPTGNNQAFNL